MKDHHLTQRLRLLVFLVLAVVQILPMIRVLPYLPEAHATTTSNAFWGPVNTLHHSTVGVDMTPSMIRSKSGGLVVAWAQQVLSGTQDVWIMNKTASSWSSPIPVNEGGYAGSSDNRSPSLVELPDRTLLVFWAQCPLTSGLETSCNIAYVSYNLQTRSFGMFNNLVSDGFFNLRPSAVITSGRLCVFWASDRLNPGIESDIYYTCSSDFGTTWNPDPDLGQAPNPMPFSVTGVEDDSPFAVPSSNAGVLLAWTSYRSTTDSTHTAHLFFTSWNGTVWTPYIQLTTDTHDNSLPSMAASNDGGIWMVFQSDRDSTSTTVFNDLYFKRSYDPMNLTSWSSDTRLTTDTNNNFQASAFQAQSGVIGVAWASNRPPATTYDLFYDTLSFHNLKVLSVSPTPSVLPGKLMSITVIVGNKGNYTESTTLNLYANSSLITPTPLSQSSLGPGLNWTATYSWNTTGQTPGIYNILARASCGCSTEENLSDNSLSSISIVAFRDVGIRSITIPRYIYRGQTINVNATVVNEGQVSENFNLILFYNSTTQSIGSATILSLPPGLTRTVSIPWNTTNVKPGACRFSAYIPPLPTETHISDNNFTASYIYANCVRKTGDVTGDGVVDINDLIAVWQHQFIYNPQYDVNGDHVVDVRDLILTYTHQFT